MSATAYINLAIQAFQRSNPIHEVMGRINAVIHMLVNYQSDVKLNKFRHSLYEQQLKRMEGFLSQASPYQYQGVKIDKKF